MDAWSASVALVAQAALAVFTGLFAPERILSRYNLSPATLIVWGVFTGTVGFVVAVVR